MDDELYDPDCASCGRAQQDYAKLEREADDLVTLVHRLARELRGAEPDHPLSAKALDYLRRKGLQGSPLRAATPTMKTQAMQDVIAERRRQIETEGWISQHDDEHTDGSLARAAACYALHAGDEAALASKAIPWRNQDLDGLPDCWPDSWDSSWWKPKDMRRNLVRAAALLIADIERLDRSTKEPTP